MKVNRAKEEDHGPYSRSSLLRQVWGQGAGLWSGSQAESWGWRHGELIGWCVLDKKMDSGWRGSIQRVLGSEEGQTAWHPHTHWPSTGAPKTLSLNQSHLPTYLALPPTLQKLKAFGTHTGLKRRHQAKEVHKSTSNFMKTKINQWK